MRQDIVFRLVMAVLVFALSIYGLSLGSSPWLYLVGALGAALVVGPLLKRLLAGE